MIYTTNSKRDRNSISTTLSYEFVQTEFTFSNIDISSPALKLPGGTARLTPRISENLHDPTCSARVAPSTSSAFALKRVIR